MNRQVIALGSGDMLIQKSEVHREKNGLQVCVDFFRHTRSHPIGENANKEDCDKKEDWEHIAVLGSNEVASLDVLIEELTKARDDLERAKRLEDTP